MQAESVLLEPFYEFTLILDRQYIGRAMTDFERMGAQFEINDNGDEAVIKGAGPVATVGNYQAREIQEIQQIQYSVRTVQVLMCLGMKSKIMHTLTACLIQWELMKM